MIGKLINNSYTGSKYLGICKSLVLTLLLVVWATSAHASILDWFSTGRSNSGRNEKESFESVTGAMVPGFEDSEQARKNQNGILQHIQQSWTNARNRYNTVCRKIADISHNDSIKDVVQKVFVLGTQVFRESIRNSATSVEEFSEKNRVMQSQIARISQIITSPGSETLESLKKALNNIEASNVRQKSLIKKYMSGTETVSTLADNNYQTLMLIPSLSNVLYDGLIQNSVQIMRLTVSNSDSFKGTLLNIDTSVDHIENSIAEIRRILSETLRFSEHFAIHQFPLVNLPTPSRERIFVQINSINNTIRNINNTVNTTGAHVRNTSGQFSDLIDSFISRALETMRYSAPTEYDKPSGQILNYTRNQVNGLFLRTGEEMNALRVNMKRAAQIDNMPPRVVHESATDQRLRQTRTAVRERLPLFLLGGSENNQGRSDEDQSQITSARRSPRLIEPSVELEGFRPLPNNQSDSQNFDVPNRFDENSSQPTTLYSENKPNNDVEMLEAEMRILQQELGSDFFFGDLSKLEAEKSQPKRKQRNFGERSFNFETRQARTEITDLTSSSPRTSAQSFRSDPELEFLRQTIPH